MEGKFDVKAIFDEDEDDEENKRILQHLVD